MKTYEELKAQLVARTTTSSTVGLDSIGKDMAKALEAIEQLERQLAKYRDAPAVASASVSSRTGIYGPVIDFDYGEALRMYGHSSGKPIALIVKPGEQ